LAIQKSFSLMNVQPRVEHPSPLTQPLQHFHSVIKFGLTPTGSPTLLSQIFPTDGVPMEIFFIRWSSRAVSSISEAFAMILEGGQQLFLCLLFFREFDADRVLHCVEGYSAEKPRGHSTNP
jgi:hypothetical protein